jgi:TRAP-type C4-dicarboxylate transport system substrate-binding protein
MFEPLLMSKSVYDRLTKEQQAAIMAVGTDLEAFARKAAQDDDAAVVSVYQRTGSHIADLAQPTIKKWQDIARATAWKDYGERNANCAKLLALAEKTL